MSDTLSLQCIELQPNAALKPLNLQLPRNSISCLVGPSDTGKTAYLRALGGVDRPLHGELRILNQPLWQLNREQRRQLRQQAGYVLPSTALLSSYSVIRNVMLPAEYHRLGNHATIDARARELLIWLGYTADLDELPGYLPGLQQRLVAIARCMMLNPVMLFIDDAFAFLDPLGAEKMSERYLDMRRELGMTLVLATHNFEFAAEHADMIVFMHPDGPRSYADWRHAVRDDDEYIQSYIRACRGHVSATR